MIRKRILLHAFTWSCIAILIIVAGDPVDAEPASEVKAIPVYVQSRPVYQKPSPIKPKLVLAKQLHPQLHLSGKSNGEKEDQNVNPNLVTQTVYGFLDFVTTIGNTVMVFTPQTKKAEIVKPSIDATTVTQEFATVTSTKNFMDEETTTENLAASSRQPKLIPMNDTSSEEAATAAANLNVPPILEASEYEPQVFATVASPTSMSTDSLEVKYVNLISESKTNTENDPKSSASFSESSKSEDLPTNSESSVSVTSTSEKKIRTQVNVVTGDSNPAPTSKGFTLKFSRPPTTPMPDDQESPPPARILSANPDEKTGLVNQIFETRIIDGVTTIHETKVLGTHIGSQYVRVLESSSTVLPVVVITASHSNAPPPPPPQSNTSPLFPHTTTTPTSTTPKLPPPLQHTTPTPKPTSNTHKKNIHFPKALTTPESQPEILTEQSVVSSSRNKEAGFDEEDERFNEDLIGEDEEQGEFEIVSSSVSIEPTPTSLDEQTLYVLPQKEKTAQIYLSAVPSPDSYSRQPQLYVDISPAKSFDNIVTATPSRKQFRQQNSRNEYLNRFSNRFRTPSSTESNELTERPVQVQTPEPTSSDENISTARRGASRFRSRNRGNSKSRINIEVSDILPTVSVYSNTVAPTTQSRRFNPSASIRARSVGGKQYSEAASFKTPSVQRGGYNQATRQQLITPTTSTSIYRFKLNRPTGRWRFKPSPKPKVNIIKTKEEEDQQNQQISTTALAARELPAPVYAPGLLTGNDGEIQIIEETRTESNELAQDAEPELVPLTIRVATITPTEFSDLDKYLEVATIRSPYVFQAGNFKNTRFITLTKTITKEVIQPTQALGQEATLENILATRVPYEKILEGSNDVATLPIVILGLDMATPPLETITQTFSTTQLMLKTSILPALYDGVTTLYTLTQSYFVTRVVRALKTVPPIELFQFAPSKSLTEFNTALQEAGSEHREQLLGSESDGEDNEQAYEHILAPPDELTSVGSDFDPTSMDEKFPKFVQAKSPKALKAKAAAEAGLPDLSKFTPEQIALLRYFSAATSGQQGQAHQLSFQQPQQFPQQQHQQPQGIPQNYFPSPLHPAPQQPQFQVTSSPIIYDTVTTIVESKTLRILFGAKPTHTTVYSTKVVPTKVTSFITISATAAIPNFFAQGAYPYVG